MLIRKDIQDSQISGHDVNAGLLLYISRWPITGSIEGLNHMEITRLVWAGQQYYAVYILSFLQ